MFSKLRSVFTISVISVFLVCHVQTPLCALNGQVSYKVLQKEYYEVCAIQKWGVPNVSDPEKTEKLYKAECSKAIALFNKATNNGNIKNAQLLCDYAMLLDAIGDEQYKSQQYKLLANAVKLGNPRAYRMFANLMASKNKTESNKWFNKALQAKDPVAMHTYASNLWNKGKHSEALRWYIASADAILKYRISPIEYAESDVNAHWQASGYSIEVGIIYENGLVNKADYKKALHWYNKAKKADGAETWLCCSFPGAVNRVDVDEYIDRVKTKLANRGKNAK